MYPQRPTTHLFVYLAAEMIATNIEEKQRTSSWQTNHSLMAQAAVRLAGRGKPHEAAGRPNGVPP